ncbi:hypothetical protein IC575_015363 [Cucumis melo]
MFKSYIPKEKISVIMAFDQVIIRSKNDSFNDGVVVTRRCANFQPSAWGDYFISCQSNTMIRLDHMQRHQINYNGSFNDNGVLLVDHQSFNPVVGGHYFLYHQSKTMEEEEMVEEEVQKLKEEVMSMFIIAQNPSQKLSLIDSIQRLGLSYHFEKEITEILHHMQKPSVVDNDENIYEVALRFRLLRQQGYAIPTEIFNKFTNEDEDFKESIVKGKREIMSLV